MSNKKASNDHDKAEEEDSSVATGFAWHMHSIEECLHQLSCPKDVIQTGLSTEQALKRLDLYGPNRLTEKTKVTLIQRIWKQVANVLVAILVFVAVV
jgi:magnesium-transporting ATPase (P-type)